MADMFTTGSSTPEGEGSVIQATKLIRMIITIMATGLFFMA
jgi:hypothetical protein